MGISHRRKGAARHVFMVWLYRSPNPVGEENEVYDQIIFTCLEKGGRESASCVYV
jgi:hypothetical protein